MAKKGQKQKRISEELILQIVNEKKKGKSYGYLANKQKVSDGSIATWVRRYNYTGTIIRKKLGKEKMKKIKQLRILESRWIY